MSFDELMAKAKAMPTSKAAAAVTNTMNNSNHATMSSRPTLSGKRPPPSSISSSSNASSSSINTAKTQQQHHTQQRNIPNIFHRKRAAQGGKYPPSSTSTSPYSASNVISSSASSSMSPVSAKDRIRQMYREPPQRLNAKKRDTRSVSEIQRDIRHSKGIYSDDEDTRSDPRLIRNKRSAMAPRPGYQRDAPMRRMPFQRPTDIRRPPMKRKMRHEEEFDEELDEFIVDDEEEEENDISAEISRIFRYDKSRYVVLVILFISIFNNSPSWYIRLLDSTTTFSRMMIWKLMHGKSCGKNEGGMLF